MIYLDRFRLALMIASEARIRQKARVGIAKESRIAESSSLDGRLRPKSKPNSETQTL